VWTIGEDGYWYKDGVKTDNRAVVSADGSITAVYDNVNGTLTLYGVDGKEDGYVIPTTTVLKGLAFVPERIFDGLGLITVYEFQAPKNNVTFPYVDKTQTTFLATAPTKVTYRMDAPTVDVTKYNWDFINRSVYTKAVADKNNLVSIEEGPVKDGNFIDFKIQLNESVEPAGHAKDNDIVALRAVSGDEIVVSDYVYIEKDINTEYALIHKDEYIPGDPRYYRVEPADVKIDDETDYNSDAAGAGQGIKVTEEGKLDAAGKLNPASPVLVYNDEKGIDLLDYVETYAVQVGDLVSTKGIEPTYKFQFAGFDDHDNIIISSNANQATYLSDDADNTNQNQFVTITGSVVKVNKEFVSSLSPAIGRTPLIYVQSIYNEKILAEGFIKIEIVDEAKAPAQTLGYKVFIVNVKK